MTFNLDTVLQEITCRQPEHAAVLGPRAADRLSYRELDEAIGHTAAELQRAGLRPGMCVGLHCRSGRDYIVFNYAIWRSGASVVPIPVELRPNEKHEIARRIRIDFLVTGKRNTGEVEPLFASAPFEVGADALAASAQPQRERPEALDRMNCAFIRFTSGTTAASKGVVLSHETISDRIGAANEVLGIGPADRIVWVLSMSYHFAVSIVCYLSFGATIVLPANIFAAGLQSAAQEHRATMIYAAPTHYEWMADYDDAQAIRSLRLAVSTTAPLAAEIAAKFQTRFQLPLSQALGIIEVGLPFINTSFAADKPGSVGRVLPAYDLCLRDIGLGARHQEVLLRGKGLLDAYYEPWQSREEVLADGWFHTGDIGELDDDGCLFLRGRAKDVISVMGMKFFPQEVEKVLQTHPSVQQASVFARPDARLGDLPWARVVTRQAAENRNLEQELRAYCRERLAEYKVPEGIEFVAAIPKTPSGKIVRRVIAS
jgi:long-chain acyl-CoA synthetase